MSSENLHWKMLLLIITMEWSAFSGSTGIFFTVIICFVADYVLNYAFSGSTGIFFTVIYVLLLIMF